MDQTCDPIDLCGAVLRGLVGFSSVNIADEGQILLWLYAPTIEQVIHCGTCIAHSQTLSKLQENDVTCGISHQRFLFEADAMERIGLVEIDMSMDEDTGYRAAADRMPEIDECGTLWVMIFQSNATQNRKHNFASRRGLTISIPGRQPINPDGWNKFTDVALSV